MKIPFIPLQNKILVVFLICSHVIFAQVTPSIKTELPQIAPPSPTVAALMKFEEVPVNNYTGIPDIAIPLYNIATRSKDIALNLTLKYHPASIAADEVASYTGLGWNLMAGGTISRTVRGIPDEWLDRRYKIGIYQTGGSNLAINYNAALSYFNASPPPNNDIINEFIYDGFEHGKYDTDQDLYQFNFMGHTGRFIIKKNTSEQLEIVRLDNDEVIKIDFTYTGYIINSFTIRDDKGYKFTFDVKETTIENSSSFNINWNGVMGGSFTRDFNYISAFHLSSVKDINENILLSFEYNDDSQIYKERKSDGSNTYTTMVNSNPSSIVSAIEDCGASINILEPQQKTYTSTRTTNTKKLQHILVDGKAIIDFNLEVGRQDDNTNADSYRLKEIIVRKWNANSSITTEKIKKIELFHGYSEVLEKRMVLQKVTESNFIDTKTISHQMFYTSADPYNLGVQYEMIGKDYWGYFNKIPQGQSNLYHEATASFVTTDVLQKISLPTGGCMVFDFESNTYSYVGDQALTDFYDNPYNWVSHLDGHIFNTSHNNNTQVFEITDAQDAYMTLTTNFGSYSGSAPDWFLNICKYPNINTPVANFTTYNLESSPAAKLQYFEPGIYYVSFFSPLVELAGINNQNHNFGIQHRSKNLTQKYLYGGGIRIKRIGYFDTDVDQRYYLNRDFQNGVVPAKQKTYNYQFFDDAQKSSGSLVFGKPIYEYTRNVSAYAECTTDEGQVMQTQDYNIMYQSFTDSNNLSMQKTHGADVGYKNVTVSESGNGYTRFVYISPIDVPEVGYTIAYPFIPAQNVDYKRGLLSNEKVYHNDGRVLTETLSVYDNDYEENQVVTGIRLSSNDPCKYAFKFGSYGVYKATMDVNAANGCPGCLNCGYPTSYISYSRIYESFGRAKLLNQTKKEYFYNGATLQGTVSSKTSYTYNPVNKQIASTSTETYNNGSSDIETMLTKYYYLSNTTLTSINNVSQTEKIETLKNGSLINAQKVIYNADYRPATIQSSKGTQSLENRIQILNYDMYGNPLEARLENGSSMVYIWGYNNTLPIAVIQKTDNVVIPSSLITTAQDASNGTSETALATALNNLRTSLPYAQVTTYIHKPLVGVTSVTDPKGSKTSYTYDGFGRLSATRDNAGKLLTENKYHYRTELP